VKVIELEGTIFRRLQSLLSEQDVLRWRALGSQTSIGMSAGAMERLLDIQRDTGASAAALAVFGAGLSLSVMYSAVRGDMWWIFCAWWCFISAVAISGMLAVLAAGSDASATRATHTNWILRRWGAVGIGISYCAVIMGLASFCVGAAGYDVGYDLRGKGPTITGGPDLTDFGDNLPIYSKVVSYVLIGTLCIIYFAAYFIRLGLRIRFKGRAQRHERAQQLAAPNLTYAAQTEIEMEEEAGLDR